MARTITGRVTSDKTDKTIVITVTARKTHPLYGKQYTRNTKFMAHDEANEAKVGDLIDVVECRPISAKKHFKLSKIVERGGVRFEEADSTADLPEEEKVLVEEPKEEPKAKDSEPEPETIETKPKAAKKEAK